MKQKMNLMKKEMDRMTHEHKTELEARKVKITTLERQIEQLKEEVNR